MVKIISVDPMDDYKLKVELSDGRKGVSDVSPYVGRGVFGELKDEGYFRSVRAATVVSCGPTNRTSVLKPLSVNYKNCSPTTASTGLRLAAAVKLGR